MRPIDNLCNSCTNIGCEFQSGIVRTECAFYMPPKLEPDNCGNYVIQDLTIKNDLEILDKIRAEIEEHAIPDFEYHGCGGDQKIVELDDILEIIDKYKAESED